MQLNVPEITYEQLQKQKLMVATPMYGGMCGGQFAKSMSDLAAVCNGANIPLQIYYLFNESLIPRARNYCVDSFLRSDCTHLMFIDADIGFNPHDILLLLGISSLDEKYNIIGGAYPKKCISWEKIKLAVDKGMADTDPNVLDQFVGDFVFNPKNSDHLKLNEPCEVLELGTGFMMITRKTFEMYQNAYPEMWYRPDHIRTADFDGSREIMTYFDCVIDRGYSFGDLKKVTKDFVSGKINADKLKEVTSQYFEFEDNHATKRYLSEDYFFCQQVQKMGGKIWLCPWIQLNHTGTMIYGGSLAALGSLGASLTADPTSLGKVVDKPGKKEKEVKDKKYYV